jgi:hypothetical protein
VWLRRRGKVVAPVTAFTPISSQYVFAKVESRQAAGDGDGLPHRGRAFGWPQFDNRF